MVYCEFSKHIDIDFQKQFEQFQQNVNARFRRMDKKLGTIDKRMGQAETSIVKFFSPGIVKKKQLNREVNKTKYLTSILLLIVLSGCSLSLRSFKSEIDGVYIPKNLTEAIEELNKKLSDSVKLEISSLTENEFQANAHFGIGLWIRNSWNLWASSRLYRYFRRKGIKHPDDMSGIILTSYYRKLTGKDVELDEQIRKYKAYWREEKEKNRLVKLPRSSKHPEPKLQFDYTMWYDNEKVEKRSMIYVQTNSKTDSVWVYDYLFGWEKMSKIKRIELKSTDNPDSLINVIFSRL